MSLSGSKGMKAFQSFCLFLMKSCSYTQLHIWDSVFLVFPKINDTAIFMNILAQVAKEVETLRLLLISFSLT